MHLHFYASAWKVDYMVKNSIEFAVKVKCIEYGKMEALGYDIELIYVRRKTVGE